MIKTTPKQILESTAGLNALLEAKLPVKAKYAVAKLARACQSEAEEFNKAREKIFEEAGCKRGEKEWEHADPEALKGCKAQVEELLGAEVEINALPLDLETFGNGEIEGPAFLNLDWAMKPDSAAA